MNVGAGVHSLDAFKDWSASLIQYREDAQNALTSLALELQRAADWLIEQQHYWRREQRKAEDAVVQAKVELQRKKHTDWLGKQPDITVEIKALAKAVARLEFIEERIDVTKRWVQDLPVAIEDTYDGPSRMLQFFLDIDMARVLSQLGRQIDSLEQYVAMTPVTSSPPPAVGGETSKPQAGPTLSPLSPVLGGEGLGVRGLPSSSPLTPNPSPPEYGGRGEKEGEAS